MDSVKLLKIAREEAEAEKQRAINVCDEFEHQYERKPSKAERKDIKGNFARMTSVVYDKNTGEFFAATSGYSPPKESFHRLLAERMLNLNNESGRSPESCAEVQALNKALHVRIDAKISEFMVATILTGDGSPQPRCENCKITLHGADVITDHLEE